VRVDLLHLFLITMESKCSPNSQDIIIKAKVKD